VPLPCAFTDLASAYSLMLDKHAGVVRFVPAYDVISTLPNWDNHRLLHSEVLEEHLPDTLRMRPQRYSLLAHKTFLTLRRSR
jgi:hypothetical protein